MVSTLLQRVGRFRKPQSLANNGRLEHRNAPEMPSGYFRRKQWLDYPAAVFLLLPALPLMLVLCCLVRLTSRGPAIYSQCRVGVGGRTFYMYKIRSMKQDAETHTGPAWTQTADPRVTLLGRFMRRYHLDELPQLFNVLQGHMSLVGPRPERPEFVDILSRRLPDYHKRLAVKPGITGLAQLNLPPDSDLDSVRRKVVLDIEYIEKAGFLLDLKLLLCTAFRLTRLSVLGVFGLQRTVVLLEQVTERPPIRLVETVVTLKQFRMQIETNMNGGNGSRLHGVKHRHLGNCQRRS